ncbi:alpha/beta hydrolase family protein [Streptomyces sp. DSM 118878]
MRRVPRVAATALAVLALAAVTPGAAHALPSADPPPPASPTASPAESPVPPGSGDGLPEGWRLAGEGSGTELVWAADEPVPMGDARVEFYAGDRLLGRPSATRDRRSFRLPLNGEGIGPAQKLRVLAGGRRLDAAGPAPRTRAPRAASPAALPPANAVDPGKKGRYRTTGGEYTLKSVKLPGLPEPVEMRADVIGPVNAPGKRPLALFLHGRHYTCYGTGDGQGGGWPCGRGTKPVPSHAGYHKAQELLASQGYVTVSIAANGINGQDDLAEDGGAQARSSLVRLHLGRWADWAEQPSGAPAAVRALAPADLSRVLLVGHSRGGEGVNRAALDSLHAPPADQDGYHGPTRWKIRGNVLIGPTAFGQNPVPDVPSATILPGCDGDVSDLQGETYVDGTRRVSRGAALHSAVYMVGANHNFFNSEWTPGQATAPADDDFGDDTDPLCSPEKKTRLTASQQQRAGATYIAAAARLFVAGDDRVRPLLDGAERRAPSADPARVLTHAVGARRTAAFLPDASTTVRGGKVCAQVDTSAARACLPSSTAGTSPHFAEWEVAPEPGRDAVALRWTRPGDPVRVSPARPVSLAGADRLALRLIVPPNTTGTKLDVTLVDASGHRAKLGRVRVDGVPGSAQTASYWAREVRVPLSPAVRDKLDLKRVKTLELTPRSRSGKAWLMDAWGWRPGTPAVKPVALPRVDVGRLTVDEGDSGVRTHHIPVRVSGRGSGEVRLFLPGPGTDRVTHRTVKVRPGTHDIDVPVEVRGNTRYGYDVGHDAFVKAVRGAVVGSHHGGVAVRDDDPMPKVTLEPVADRVTEGKPLKWRMTLSETVDADITAGISFLPVDGGAELSTLDVDKGWLRDVVGVPAGPARKLSRMSEDDESLYVSVPAGKKSTEVRVPTVKDDVREPAESLKARLSVYDGSWEPRPGGPVVTGTVRNAG